MTRNAMHSTVRPILRHTLRIATNRLRRRPLLAPALLLALAVTGAAYVPAQAQTPDAATAPVVAPPADPAAPETNLPAEAAPAPAPDPAPVVHPPVWPDEVLDAFALVPVQDGGRVKPMDTFAQFSLLQLNGKRSLDVPVPDGAEDELMEIGPRAWLLNCLLFSEAAKEYRHFLVADANTTITAIGVEAHEARRDRYSYNELLPGRDRLMQLATQYVQIEDKNRSPQQRQIINLAQNLQRFEQFTRFMDFARADFTLSDQGALDAAFPEGGDTRFSTVVQRIPGIMRVLREQAPQMSEEAIRSAVRPVLELLDQVGSAVSRSDAVAMLPPPDLEMETWLTPADLTLGAFAQYFNVEAEAFNEASPVELEELQAALSNPAYQPFEALELLEQLHFVREDPAALAGALEDFTAATAAMADRRGEYENIPLEVWYYDFGFEIAGRDMTYGFLGWSQALFVLSFILVALSWLFTQRRGLYWSTIVAVIVPWLLLVAGITVRCLIRDRPPVSTLYETILFITAVVIFVAVIMELINRQRIAIATASVLGCVGLFLAFRYEAKEGTDTMPSLIAVLDTNFWLSTHVTTVTIGYAAGLLAAGIAHVYLFGQLFKWRRDTPAFYKGITRMIYGAICFGLLFATVGTILGGIWANDSWGRFWGWDPKENGALMIVLWGLVLLHARMGGYIRDLGLSMGAIIMGMIVVFSWWGVNLLGVGLHSYGFTSGVGEMLLVYWGVETLVLAVGLTVWLRDQKHMEQARLAEGTGGGEAAAGGGDVDTTDAAATDASSRGKRGRKRKASPGTA